MHILERIRQRAAAKQQHIVLPEGNDPRTVVAAGICSSEKIARITLLGDETMLVGRDPSPGETLEDQEDLARLRKAILNLAESEKEVFLLRQNGGFTYEEIAEMRRAPVGTVKTQMRSALQKLRKILA